LKSHATATSACDSECEYCEAEEEPRTGNDGVEEFSVTRIRDDDWEGPSTGDRFITKKLICEFKKMQAKALADGYPRLKIVSGFRSLERQTHLSEKSGCTGEGSSRSCATGPFIEKPGTSEHGIGIALDIMTRCGKCHINCKKDSHPDSACKTKELTFLKEHANAHNFFPSIEGSPGHFVYDETKEKEQKAEEAAKAERLKEEAAKKKKQEAEEAAEAERLKAKRLVEKQLEAVQEQLRKEEAEEVCPDEPYAIYKRSKCNEWINADPKVQTHRSSLFYKTKGDYCKKKGCCWQPPFERSESENTAIKSGKSKGNIPDIWCFSKIRRGQLEKERKDDAKAKKQAEENKNSGTCTKKCPSFPYSRKLRKGKLCEVTLPDGSEEEKKSVCEDRGCCWQWTGFKKARGLKDASCFEKPCI